MSDFFSCERDEHNVHGRGLWCCDRVLSFFFIVHVVFCFTVKFNHIYCQVYIAINKWNHAIKAIITGIFYYLVKGFFMLWITVNVLSRILILYNTRVRYQGHWVRWGLRSHTCTDTAGVWTRKPSCCELVHHQNRKEKLEHRQIMSKQMYINNIFMSLMDQHDYFYVAVVTNPQRITAWLFSFIPALWSV